MRTLDLPSELLDKRQVTNIVLDTTGLKVHGKGEWRAEKYRGRKRWKKLHLAMDLKTGKLIFTEITVDDHGIPLAGILSSASLNDNQVKI